MPEKIEKQEVWFIDGGYQSFHAQAIPVFHPAGLIISEPNKSHSWFFSYGVIKRAKLNVRATLREQSKILAPATGQVLIK